MTGAPRCSRRIRWISSVGGDPALLAGLEREMARFYGRRGERRRYQAMLDRQEDEEIALGSVRQLLPRYVREHGSGGVLEVGCADGRLFRHLRREGFEGGYTGTEVAAYLIAANRRRHPQAAWLPATAYALPFPAGAFSLCFSLYVLEHLVYPRRGLEEMLRVVRPGGRLVLVFPDFTVGGILPSQLIGLSPGGTARQKLRAGRPLDAVVSLYDSRIRMPRLLRAAAARHGPFPVNTRPLCLCYPHLMAPDVDAVYIASREEVARWAHRRGHAVEYPAGSDGELAFQVFMAVIKGAGG